MKHLYLISICGLWLANPTFALAQSYSDDDDIVVTATGTETDADRVAQSITVLDRDVILARQTVSVADLIATTPAITVTRNGGPGGFTGIRIRGAEAEQTLVLIDGIKISDPAAPGGGFDFANLLTGNVARIEILRGPNSLPWGSQAIGGVVNIATVAPREGLSLDGFGEIGERDTRIAGNVGLGIGPVKAAIGAGWYRSDGISAFNEERGGAERDGYERRGATGRLSLDLSDDLGFDVGGYIADAELDIDGFPPPDFAFADTAESQETQEILGYAGARIGLFGGRFRNRLTAAFTRVDRDSFDPAAGNVPTFKTEGETTRLSWRGEIEFGAGLQGLVGAEHEQTELFTLAGPSAFDPDPQTARAEANIDSGYAQLVATPLDGLTLIGGGRYDHHDEFGGEESFAAGATYQFGATILRASYGEGFKAPTLFQLESDFGNRTLQPETARGYDIGIEQRLLGEALSLSATGFRRDTRNQIDFVSCFGSTAPICTGRPFGTYDNVARTRAQGIELELAARPIDALRLVANYALVDAENRSPASPNIGNELARRARHTANASADMDLPFGLAAGATVRMVGDSFDDAANTVPTAGYTLVDVRAALSLAEGIEAFGRVENLLDERYETVFLYGTPHRSVTAGIRARF